MDKPGALPRLPCSICFPNGVAILIFCEGLDAGIVADPETRHVALYVKTIAEALFSSLRPTAKLLSEEIALVPRGWLRSIRHALRYQEIKIGEARSFVPVERLRHVVLRGVIPVLEPILINGVTIDLGI